MVKFFGRLGIGFAGLIEFGCALVGAFALVWLIFWVVWFPKPEFWQLLCAISYSDASLLDVIKTLLWGAQWTNLRLAVIIFFVFGALRIVFKEIGNEIKGTGNENKNKSEAANKQG
jgi:hypothetical protein